MNHDIKHYVHKDRWINDELCDEVIATLNKEDTWLPFPKDVINAYPDAPRKQDGIKGSTLSIDWEQFMGDPNIPEQDRNYGLTHMQNTDVMQKLRKQIHTGATKVFENYISVFEKHFELHPWLKG